MAFGKSNQEQIIKEGLVEEGTWVSPHLINPSVDPNLSFTPNGDVGYFSQGSGNVELNRTFAQLIAGTPGKNVRKDLIQKDFILNLTMTQFNTDLFELIQGLDVDTGTYDVVWIGSDEPLQTFHGYRLTTQYVDGTPIYVCMWYGKQTGEAVGIPLPGTDYATSEFKTEAFEHPDFTGANADDTHNYGAIIIDNS